MSGPAVRLCGVTKSFDGAPVLAGIDLDVSAGERIVVIGPSGSGKSTLLRIVMGLTEPDGGSVEIAGRPLWTEMHRGAPRRARPAHRRAVLARVGMVFQHFHLFPHRTALRNVTEAPIHVRGVPRDEARAAGVALLERVGLGDKLDAYPAQLSGGQKQRVAIARALALDPGVMLFDEVTSALDPELVGEVLAVLRDLALDGRRTMLLVTHHMRFAADIATRVVFMDGGVVVESGTPQQVLCEPAHDRTRAFLGSLTD